MKFEAALLILSGYFLGSIPTAYFAARAAKRIDLRFYGSGTVSGSMVYEHVAHWMIIPVGLIDIAKAAIPTWLALEMGLGEMVACLTGLAAIAGHNWPIYLGFTGGRGITPFLGVLLVLLPWGFPWMLGFLAIGFLLGDSAPWTLLSLISLPLLITWLKAPLVLELAIAGMFILTILKRLEANRRPLPVTGPDRWRVIFRRLLLDRDISNHKEWINRKPN
jgi:acyl phosphate:glycerol-3-phosphate acyltransferase